MIYTANTWGKDKPAEGIKCFSRYNHFKDSRRNAKIYKVLSHLYIKDEYSIWIDANIELKVSEQELIDLLGEEEIAAFPHPYFDCLFDEANACMAWKKDDPEIIKKQIERYKNFPKHAGLWACGVLIRKHTERIKRLNEQWWAEICRGSVRDQISFPYVFKDIVKTLEPVDLLNNKYFKRYGHKT